MRDAHHKLNAAAGLVLCVWVALLTAVSPAMVACSHAGGSGTRHVALVHGHCHDGDTCGGLMRRSCSENPESPPELPSPPCEDVPLDLAESWIEKGRAHQVAVQQDPTLIAAWAIVPVLPRHPSFTVPAGDPPGRSAWPQLVGTVRLNI
jgi:hypothetical protein